MKSCHDQLSLIEQTNVALNVALHNVRSRSVHGFDTINQPVCKLCQRHHLEDPCCKILLMQGLQSLEAKLLETWKIVWFISENN